MPASPDRADLDILLRILEIYPSEPVRKARSLWRTIPAGLSFAELDERYPRGSEGFEHIDTVMIVWEAIGSMLKHVLLNKDLAFDTVLDAPPWKKVEAAALALREEQGKSLELENLEYACRRAQEWIAAKRPEKG